jgi:hypothetical protein
MHYMRVVGMKDILGAAIATAGKAIATAGKATATVRTVIEEVGNSGTVVRPSEASRTYFDPAVAAEEGSQIVVVVGR